MIPWFGFVIMLGFAYFFNRAAAFENLDRPFPWGGVAALLYVVSVRYLHFDILTPSARPAFICPVRR